MRRAVSLLLLLLLAFGCSSGTVEPGDGPAATEEPTAVEGGPSEGDAPLPEDEASATAEPAVAAFGEKFVYPDGLEVEIIRIRHGRLSDDEWKENYSDEPSPDWVGVTMRVRNGSEARISLSETADITYGPDGVQASRYADEGNLDGPLLPGKAKSMKVTVYIPDKYQDDVVWVQNVDFEREPAIFSGSMKGDLN